MVRFLFLKNFTLKMKYRIFVILMLAVSVFAFAGPKDKNAKDALPKKGTGKVYVFGFSQQLTDTLAFITVIQEVDSIDLEKKTMFLPYRSEFSIQFKQYLEGTEKMQKQTACVFFAPTRKKLAKAHSKMVKRYLENAEVRLVMIDDDKFKFKNPFDAFEGNEE